ncbi:LPS ABC transporter substrate-binding protein LptA [Campylobacter fetus]|uniref:Organic solvent tolerance protein OstA n=1 Tax=Campylobacter fetus subsp. testudinum TaxID=1507806 RepID=A0AAX0HDM1_CAMFE|nr:LPS ABC transporter substrate-binding protein LptA [Campylobacter fetus]AGZ82023.1 putative lipooligosaccharide transport system, periplasmic component (LptA family) [Campylobacter fetus subsp. testudinum 03-427]AJB45758.1 organic solvent tolerance protein OstA [Campylobacter fetus subsp. testudinum]ALV65189.1 putative lipooligosaccharide transport system, periplasmic component (LptA family) [Campylobacter fetus subsp. testudinum Sp3]AVK81457.1 LPS ABC transporter substrate-binding protein L
MVLRKVVLILCFFTIGLNAEQVEVTADNFFADEKSLTSDLKGNVIIKKGSYDTLTSNSVKIYFDAKRQPIKYVATGNAKFKAVLNKKNYNGSGDILIYEPLKKTYTLSGDAYLHEEQTDKKVYGDEIVVNQGNGTYKVSSKDKKPVKLIFQVEDK